MTYTLVVHDPVGRPGKKPDVVLEQGLNLTQANSLIKRLDPRVRWALVEGTAAPLDMTYLVTATSPTGRYWKKGLLQGFARDPNLWRE
jgi:hypothetical protein